ncbi:MAG TPA: RHS repeat-associated core domain-containing protein [Solirubrobacteraceae bacterium]|nr:RHS repeat-associated core domain-containing protein [Solirubrobacteraceae bacterium]
MFFPSVAEDTDSIVTPTLNGAEFFAVLRSRLSPQQLRYKVTLPAGAVLSTVAGGAVVSQSGVTLARVPAPTARDAQGVTVPVQMNVAGDELILSVKHRELDVAYPVIVDPSVVTVTSSPEGWAFKTGGLGNFTGTAGEGITVTAPEARYPVRRENEFHESELVNNSSAKWEYTPPSSPEFIAVEFDGTKFSASAVREKGEMGYGVYWSVGACDRGAGGQINVSPPPESVIPFYGERSGSLKCEDPIKVGLSMEGTGSETNRSIESGSVSVAAIVMTARYHSLSSEEYGPGNPGAPGKPKCFYGKPVNCATGNEIESQTDFTVGGRGPGLSMTRTYNSQLAESESEPGPFGYGWTGPYSAHIVVEKPCRHCEIATVYQENGSTVYFEYANEKWVSSAPLVQATLENEGSGYVYTLPNQLKLTFNSAGRLTSETDRNGNTLTMNRNSEGRLESVSDPAGRKLTFAYNGSGEIESAIDPMSHVVKYTYESGNLVGVTQPGEASLRWKFKYNSSHEMTEMTDGRGNTTTTEYNGSHQVISQTDPLSRKRTWKYGTITEGTYTEITEPNGAVTREEFNPEHLPISVTHAYGTALASTTTYEYEGDDNLASVTDPNRQTTTYTYNAKDDRLSEKDPNGNETKWTYDSTHDVTSITTPKGETTTIKRNSDGDAETVERPAPGEKTQSTKYAYGPHGEVESMTNPLGHVWKYEYDTYGDRTAEIDPESNKRTWEYNEDSQEIAMVSPRGNVTGAEPAVFTTTTERDQQGRPASITEPPREPVYNTAFGSSGSGNGQFQFPTLGAVTSSGDLWVADSSLNRLQEFNTKGEYVTQFGSSGTGDGQFKFPFGVAINKTTGDIYVADRENYRIQEFSSTGAFIRAFGYGVSDGTEKYEVCTSSCRAGLMGSKASEFWEPDGIAIDSSGNLWVVDEVNDRLEEINETGEYINEYGSKGTGNGQLSEPVAIAYDKGNLYVTEAINDRVQEFSTEGVYVSKFGSEGTGNGQFEIPYAIAAGPTTNELYVTDRENNRVEIFTTSGRFLSSFGSKGKGNGDMESPTGVVAATGETLYVSDHNNERIENWTGLTARITKYAYDADGNLESMTDPNGNKTKYSYDADNELTKVEEPNGTVTETGYDSAGKITSQTDGSKHTTKYVRNALEEITEIIDPLTRKTTKEYDAEGNLTSVTDAAKRTTTYKYDPANRLTEVTYSDGKTPTVKYEYDKDGNLTKMTDGTGTTKFVYDQLDHLTEAENGHKELVKYEYDLANEKTKIIYPNGKSVTDGYDKDGRLEKVTDWLEHTTKFSYDPDSDLTATVYPSGTSEEDTYAYNLSDQMSETKMTKGAETLASLAYARNADGQVDNTISKGLLGSEVTEATYDPNNRLTESGATAYKYDATNDPTEIGAHTYKYDSADELENGTGTTYAYDEMGERTKTTPGTGPATTYGYDQAGNLISVERPKEGATSEIKDTYTYNGEGLRASQTISGTTSYLVWDLTESTPLILSDGTNSYIYGADGIPIEQINSAEKAQYLHHDQAGSTQFIASETGTTEAAYAYTPYGTVEEHTGAATTPFGYDGQYASSDTGLIYLRARVYDPNTAQFLSVDPLEKLTRAPYDYAEDNPLNESDPTGESIFGSIGKILFPGGGSGQACAGATVSIGAVTLGGEVCYVHTPHGEGVTLTPSVTVGPGFGANIHAGAGESNACSPSEYGGPFSQLSGSAAAGFMGGYYNRFSNWPFNEGTGGRRVEGWTAGTAAGLGAEAGAGGSYTFTIPIGSENGGSESSACGCS